MQKTTKKARLNTVLLKSKYINKRDDKHKTLPEISKENNLKRNLFS